MLDTPRRRRAECERDGGYGRARRGPSLVLTELEDGKAAEGEHREHVNIELPEAWDFFEVGEDDGRREDQGLRVGDLRHADEAARIPEWRLARVQRVGEKLELFLEQGLGVIGYRDRAAQPRPGQDEPGGQVYARGKGVVSRAPRSQVGRIVHVISSAAIQGVGRRHVTLTEVRWIGIVLPLGATSFAADSSLCRKSIRLEDLPARMGGCTAHAAALLDILMGF